MAGGRMARAASSKSSSFSGTAGPVPLRGAASAMRPRVPFSKMDLADRQQLLTRLREVVGEQHAFADPYEMRLYQYDASPETALPDIVVIPGTAKEVAQVVKLCADAAVPIQ